MPAPDAVIDAIGALLPPLLDTLERMTWVQRFLHPPVAGRLADGLAPSTSAVTAPLAALEALAWPDDLRFMRDRLRDVARQTLEMVGGFVEAARGGDVTDLYRALRRFARVQEALYPLAPVLDPVSRWFLEPARRADDALVERLRAGALRDPEARVGVLHADNERDARGGFSLYVPETWDGRAPMALPMALIVALHGGHGHGRDFLWTWLREARARGMLVLAPTARGRTWSIMGGPDVDAESLTAMVESVAARYPVDRARVLLTGMSDGATYAMLAGLREGAPFTHLAPACGMLHPALLMGGGIERARGRPIYLVHGALDWMFPVATARMAEHALRTAGARLVYREIADLSHTYPRDENPAILDWLAG
jgi:phospholipase/carboxylesterase